MPFTSDTPYPTPSRFRGPVMTYELVTLGRELGIRGYSSQRRYVVGDRIEARGVVWTVQRIEPAVAGRGQIRLICLEEAERLAG
jgi:hypothetical protein